MPLKIEFEGQVYEFDELDLDVDEAETIQKYVGRSLGDWSNGLSVCEIKSVMALWWLLRKRAGMPARSIAAAPQPGFKPLRLWNAWAEAVKAEGARVAAEQAAEQAAAEAAAAADPTPPAAPSSPERSAATPTTPVTAPATLSQPG